VCVNGERDVVSCGVMHVRLCAWVYVRVCVCVYVNEACVYVR